MCLSLEEVLRAVEDRTVWWKIAHDAANARTVEEGRKTRQLQPLYFNAVGCVTAKASDQ